MESWKPDSEFADISIEDLFMDMEDIFVMIQNDNDYDRFDEGIAKGKEAAIRSKKDNDLNSLVKALGSMGVMYSSIDPPKNKEAIDVLEECLKYVEKIEDPSGRLRKQYESLYVKLKGAEK